MGEKCLPVFAVMKFVGKRRESDMDMGLRRWIGVELVAHQLALC